MNLFENARSEKQGVLERAQAALDTAKASQELASRGAGNGASDAGSPADISAH